MDNDLRRVNSKANAGMATGITALGIEAASLLSNGGLGNVLGGLFGSNRGSGDAAAAAAIASAMSGIASMAAMSGGNSCSDDHLINRYEAGKDARIAELETEVKLRDANTYTDGKLLEMYKYVDGRLRGVEGQISQQAVYNATNTAALNCMQGQIAQLLSLTKIVVPNSSICPGWGAVNVTPETAGT